MSIIITFKSNCQTQGFPLSARVAISKTISVLFLFPPFSIYKCRKKHRTPGSLRPTLCGKKKKLKTFETRTRCEITLFYRKKKNNNKTYKIPYRIESIKYTRKVFGSLYFFFSLSHKYSISVESILRVNGTYSIV